MPGQTVLVARGGRGGKGNLYFKTHSNTAPWVSTDGERGKMRWVELELKIVADIGIIGVPNAGKSSLLAAVTNSWAKIASYAFTTVDPNVGFYRADEHGGLTLVDVPGLIDGASSGRGMGMAFLRHLERCRTLIHVVSGNSEDPLGDYDMIQRELSEYGREVDTKPQVIVVNKCDIPEVKEKLPELMAALRRRCGHSRVFDISAATKYNTEQLLERVYKWHKSIVKQDWAHTGAPSDEAELILSRRLLTDQGVGVEPVIKGAPVTIDEGLPRGRRRKTGFQARVEWDVRQQAWRLVHPEVEKIGLLNNWKFPDGLERFNKVCKETGMTEAMAAAGIKDGEFVIVNNHKFLYEPSRIGTESRMLLYEMELETEDGEDKKKVKSRWKQHAAY